MANATRGAYYKARSKRWLERQGYEVGPLEVIRVVMTENGLLPVKRDSFGADLLAMQHGLPALFVQVKSGKRLDIRAAFDRFHQHSFASDVRRVIHYWRVGARAPEVHECPTILPIDDGSPRSAAVDSGRSNRASKTSRSSTSRTRSRTSVALLVT